jgi:hypothetical protein
MVRECHLGGQRERSLHSRNVHVRVDETDALEGGAALDDGAVVRIADELSVV